MERNEVGFEMKLCSIYFKYPIKEMIPKLKNYSFESCFENNNLATD